MKAMSLAAAFCVVLTTISPVKARTAVEQAGSVQPGRKVIIDRIIAIVRTEFAFPEKRQRVIARLSESLSTGRYDTDDHTFASRISSDLMATGGDKHLYLLHDPAKQIALSNSSRISEDTTSAPDSIMAARFKRENQGLVEQKVLPGNVRYLNIVAFDWTIGVTGQVYDDALRFLRGGDAIIIDLRENAGGIPDAVRYILSYFTEPGELLATFYRGSTATELRALDNVPGGRITGKPLYLLTSAITASAAEEFAYYVTNHHAGEVIGERTAGAGNIKDDFPIVPGFVLSVSVARSVDPLTHSNWEGIGITPYISIPGSEALAAAHVRALERLSAAGGSSKRPDLVLDLRLARARWHPPQIGQVELAPYAGMYGERRIWVTENRLYWRRSDQPEIPMEPLGDNWFLLGNTGNQAHFEMLGGKSTSVTVSRPDGDGSPVARTGP